MGDRFLEVLLNGMKRLYEALGNYRKWYTTPPSEAQQSETYTDQW